MKRLHTCGSKEIKCKFSTFRFYNGQLNVGELPDKCITCKARYSCLTDVGEPKKLPKVAFRVPNDDEGKLFMKLLQKYVAKDRYKIQKYGRANNRKSRGFGQDSVPITKSDWVGVYLQDTFLAENIEKYLKWKNGH